MPQGPSASGSWAADCGMGCETRFKVLSLQSDWRLTQGQAGHLQNGRRFCERLA